MRKPRKKMTEEERREKRRASSRKYAAAHPDRIKEYRQKNKKQIREKCRRWRENNKERHDGNRAAWEAANPDRRKDFRYLARYGLTKAEVDAIYASQDHRCVICLGRKTLVVDHCHKTKKVRGGLCQKCNQGLGRFKDNVEIMKKAIEYLLKHEGRVD